MKLKTFFLLVVLAAAGYNLALAQAPKTLTYQGNLRNAGNPVTGTHNLNFAIFDAASGGNQLWTETINGVVMTNGNFTVILGKITPINIAITTIVYLEIAIADLSVTITPRVELTGTLFSLNNWSLNGNSGTVTGTNFIGTTDDVAVMFKQNNQIAGLISNATDRNTFFGYQAGNVNTGTWNTVVGSRAFRLNTSGISNSVVGERALELNTTGNYNVAMGSGAILFNTEGSDNVALGTAALQFNRSGSGATAVGRWAMQNSNDTATPFFNTNVAVGYEALRGSATPAANIGINNTAVGYQSMQNNSSGGSNTANGFGALFQNTTGNTNSALGNGVLYANTTGSSNSAFGNSALTENTTGNGNTGVGELALYNNTVGNYNTAFGVGSLDSNIAGSNGTAIGTNAMLYVNDTATPFTNTNVAVGFEALRGSGTPSANTGLNNTVIGYSSMQTNTGGNDNVAVGYQALVSNTIGEYNTAIGASALSSNIDGDNNTAIGEHALSSNTTGNYNVAIGLLADVTTGGLSKATAIGYNAKVGASNSLVLGGTGGDAVNVGIGTATPAETLDVLGTVQVTTNNGSNGISVTNSATGSAGFFSVTNAASGATALVASTNNTNAAFYSTTSGTGISSVFNHAGASGQIIVAQSSGSAVARIDKTGKGFFNGGTQTGGADIAELFEVDGTKNEYEPGDVLVISESADRTVEKCSSPSSSKVAGVYATKPGVTLTENDIEDNLDHLVPMGVIGVIPTKVCSENGPIKRGDLLVTSSKPGCAMKAISKNCDGIFPAGVILGKALENFNTGEIGLIKVLVNVK